jgi:hypothetical protein
MADPTIPDYSIAYYGIGGTSTIEVDDIDGSRQDLDFRNVFDGELLQRVGNEVIGFPVPTGTLDKALYSIIRTTAAFTISSLNNTIAVSENKILAAGQLIYVSGAGYFNVVSVTTDLAGFVVSIVAANKLFTENAIPTTIVPTNSDVVVVGANQPVTINTAPSTFTQFNRLQLSDPVRSWYTTVGANGLVTVYNTRNYRISVQNFNTLPGPIGSVSAPVDISPLIATNPPLADYNIAKAYVMVLNIGTGLIDYFKLNFLVSWNGANIAIVGNKSSLQPISFNNNYSYSLNAVGTSFIINFGAVANLQVRIAYEIGNIN